MVMSDADAAFFEMLVLCSAAAVLILLGGARAATARRSGTVRWSISAVCALLPAAVMAASGFPAAAAVAVGVVAVATVGMALVGSEAVLARVVAVLRQFGRPGVQAAVLSAGGAALLVGSLTRYEGAFHAEMDADLEFMSKVTWKPPLGPTTAAVATTDAGRRVELLAPKEARPPAESQSAEHNTLLNMGFVDRMIRIEPASDTCNCHGWVFAGGRYWIGPEDVEKILADNGYHTVSDPRPGDVAVYRDGTNISHTGLVRTGGAGMPLLIESKWGWMGVFLHRPDDTCYGRHYTFYRAARESHFIAGLSGPSAPGRGDAPPVTEHVIATGEPVGH
jgi:hypothetical protein